MHDGTTRFSALDGVHDLGWDETSFLNAAIKGLSREQKALPCQFLYDEYGSQLFDRICDLPEYYQTRTEIAILTANAKAIAREIGPNAVLYELGSGSSIKTPILLDALETPAAYAPIDISREHLLKSSDSLARDYPALRVETVVGDYATPDLLPPLEAKGRQAAFFPGSTIGNLTHAEAAALLKRWRIRLGADGVMVIGVDLKKDPAIIERAYNDSEGVTESFIRNMLTHANAEMGADFDIDSFDYQARYNPDPGRIEMYLLSRVQQSVHVGDSSFDFAPGERLHIENSHKFSPEEFAALAASAGFAVKQFHTDPKRLFSVQVLAAAG